MPHQYQFNLDFPHPFNLLSLDIFFPILSLVYPLLSLNLESPYPLSLDLDLLHLFSLLLLNLSYPLNLVSLNLVSLNLVSFNLVNLNHL